jgi:hypothetical protein
MQVSWSSFENKADSHDFRPQTLSLNASEITSLTLVPTLVLMVLTHFVVVGASFCIQCEAGHFGEF